MPLYKLTIEASFLLLLPLVEIQSIPGIKIYTRLMDGLTLLPNPRFRKGGATGEHIRSLRPTLPKVECYR